MTQDLQIETIKQQAIAAYKEKNFGLSAQRFGDAYQLNNQDLESLINWGVALKNAGQIEVAIEKLIQAIENQPSNVLAKYNLGNCYLSVKNFSQAIKQYELCLTINPSHLDAWLNLGISARESGDLLKAEKAFISGLQIRPENAIMQCNHALTLHRLGKAQEAVIHFKKATTLAPSFAEAYAGLGASLADLGQWHEAIEANEQAVKIRPDFVEALNNLATYLMCLAKYDRALEVIDQALKISPNHVNARYNRGLIRLLKGQYLEGFRDYEERYNPKRSNNDRTILPAIYAPNWHGEPLAGKTILIWQEQGAGDSIQCARFAKELCNLGAKVWFATSENLKNILSTCPWIDRTLLQAEVGKTEGFDYWVMALSLPFLLEIEPNKIKDCTPYLLADEVKRKFWRDGLAKQTHEAKLLKVGLVWAGNPDHSNDRYRSIKAEDLAPLAEVQGVSWVSLQVHESANLKLPKDFPIARLGEQLADYTDTAALLKELDLLVTVDTSVAHLAGALGIPTYLMLAANPDWRWMDKGSTTHWYPSVRLIRQQILGSWAPVLETVKKAISRRLKGEIEFDEDAVERKDGASIEIVQLQQAKNPEALLTSGQGESKSASDQAQIASQTAIPQAQQNEVRIQTTDTAVVEKIESARKDAREGRVDEAIKTYESILKSNPTQPDALYGLGRAWFSKDQFENAARLMKEAIQNIQNLPLAQKESFEGPWSRDLGVCLQRLGKDEEAAQVFYKAQELRPDLKIGDWLLKTWTRKEGPTIQKAVAFHKAGKEKNAEKLYKEILQRDAHNGEALHLLGCILLNRKAYDEAEKLIRKASRLCPSSHVYQRNLAALLIRSGRSEEAIRTWRHVLTLASIDENAIIDVANALMEHGAYQDAVAAYKKSLEKNPNNARSHASIGRSYTLLKSDDEAKVHLLRAEELDPKMLDPQLLLSRIAVDQGNYEDAARHMQSCKTISPRHPYVVWTDAFIGLGIYYDTFEQSQQLMKDFTRRMNSLAKYLSKATIAEIENAVGYRQPYELAYFQENNHDRLEAYGKAVTLGMSRWQKEKKIPIPKPKKQTGKTRVGIVMGFFFNHSVWNALIKGWMSASPKDEIEFYAFHTRPISDKDTQIAIQHAAKFTPSPKSLFDWATAISEAQCDVLIYPEIGMENMTVKLASMRLAPVQVGSWGHAEGSGLPTLDYYLTGDLIEPPNAQDNYVEKVVRLPNLGCYIEQWDVTPEDIKPEEYGLDPARPWLVSPGSPYKYRPEDDHMWLDVAKRLPQAQLIFFMHTRRQGVSNRIHGRLERMFEEAGMKLANHAVFIPWMTANKFFGLMKRSTVFLDTIGFSGFNTAQQGLECGLPVVTIRGKFMRGLLATGLLERIDVRDTITESKQDYIDCVAKLVEDPLYAEDVRSRIKKGLPVIYKDPQAIEGFVKFVRDVHQKSAGAAK